MATIITSTSAHPKTRPATITFHSLSATLWAGDLEPGALDAQANLDPAEWTVNGRRISKHYTCHLKVGERGGWYVKTCGADKGGTRYSKTFPTWDEAAAHARTWARRRFRVDVEE